MNPLEWINKATDETDEIWSSANSVLHGMLLDGSWEGTDPSEAAKDVLSSIVNPEVTSGTHWVCQDCIGPEPYEEYTIGLWGKSKCEVCGGDFPQPPLSCISHSLYLRAVRRSEYLKLKQEFGA